MAISTTIISETYTETTETREKEVPYVDSKKLNNRLESLRQRLKEYKNDKQCIAQEMYDISLNIEIYQESVKNKQKMIDDLNSGMNMILKETQKWIDVWKKEEGRVRLEKNAKNINENYIQVDQLSTYIMHLREAILNKRILIEQREIDLENRKELNKMSIEEIKDEIKVLKDGISNLKIFIQALWRHGDRSPAGTYPNDPYPESFWPVPWGQLSPLGMDMHFRQGLKIKERYVNQYKLISPTYKSAEVKARSTDVDRCLASAYSSLAGLYSDSVTSYPSNNTKWPKNWTPIPVHTVPLKDDNLLNPDFACIKMEEEEAKLGTQIKFLEYAASKASLLLEVSRDSGLKITDIRDLKDLFDSLKIEKYHNLTLPSWVTDSLYNELEDTVNTVWDLLGGQTKIGIPENSKLIKLKGGNLLKTMINNMEDVKNQINNGGVNSQKYNIFSAHDTTVSAFLRTLGAKSGVIGNYEPEFASIVLLELWKDNNKNFFVEVLYSNNADSPFRSITQYVTGCNNASYCPLDDFIARSKMYIPDDIEKDCL